MSLNQAPVAMCRWLLPVLILITLLPFTFSLSSVAPSTTYKFRGHDIFAEVSKFKGSSSNKPAVILVHGFGCSTTYWRETVKYLSQDGYEVHALDLLGQGRSSKPGRADGIVYSINLWAQLLDEYAQENIQGDSVVLMGNSLGSLVALSSACGDYLESPDSFCFLREKTMGICMFNCGVGMNSRNIAKEPQWNPTQRFLINRLFDVINFLIFGNIPLLSFLLKNVVTKELLRDALLGLYSCAEDPSSRVDEALVDSFYLPAQDDGAVEALSQIYCNDAGATPMELHDRHAHLLQNIPIHLVWGDADAVTPIQGGLGTYYSNLAADDRTNISMDVIHGGHIPFDEVPQVSNGAMLEWLSVLVAAKQKK